MLKNARITYKYSEIYQFLRLPFNFIQLSVVLLHASSNSSDSLSQDHVGLRCSSLLPPTVAAILIICLNWNSNIFIPCFQIFSDLLTSIVGKRRLRAGRTDCTGSAGHWRVKTNVGGESLGGCGKGRGELQEITSKICDFRQWRFNVLLEVLHCHCWQIK